MATRPNLVDLGKVANIPPTEREVEDDIRLEVQKIQKDQRIATAMNAVTQARMHSGRPADVATPKDAATAIAIANLLHSVAGEATFEPDKLFTELPKSSLHPLIEFLISAVGRHKEEESKPGQSTDNSTPPVD